MGLALKNKKQGWTTLECELQGMPSLPGAPPLSFIDVQKESIPGTAQRLLQPDGDVDGGIFGPRLDFLNEPAAQVGFFSQFLLGEMCLGPQAADVLAEKDVGRRLHPRDNAVPFRVESALWRAFLLRPLQGNSNLIFHHPRWLFSPIFGRRMYGNFIRNRICFY